MYRAKHLIIVLSSLLLCCMSMAATVPAHADEAAVLINEVNFPDAGFRTHVASHYDLDHDGELSNAECSRVKKMELEDIQIASLKGIAYFFRLTSLEASGIGLAELDVSQNKRLKNLNCSANNLKQLDVSRNRKLTWLGCSANELTELNVDQNTALETLICDQNKLAALDVRQNKKLTHLYCCENRLRKLDVSRNARLAWLDCSDNRLKKLDVTKLPELYQFFCSSNRLTKLDVTKNTKLYRLHCDGNQIICLDISQNRKLNYRNTGADQEYLRCDTGTEIIKSSKNVQLKKLTGGKKSFRAGWSKATAQITGYELQYAASSRFSQAKTVKIKNAKTTGITIKKLKSGRKYYARIRTCTKQRGKTFRSRWSETKSVTVK